MSNEETNERSGATDEYGKFSASQLQGVLRSIETEDVIRQKHRKAYIEMLHEYNDLKDSTQIALGALANMYNTTVREMHLKYGLPMTD